MLCIGVLATAASEMTLLPVTLSLAILAGVGVGCWWLFALSLERIIHARAHLMKESMSSIQPRQVAGGVVIPHHRSIHVEFIPSAPAQLPAPVKPELSPADEGILLLLEATILHEHYGPESVVLISADDSRAAGVTTSDGTWAGIVREMLGRDMVMTGNRGTRFVRGYTPLKLYRDVLLPPCPTVRAGGSGT